MKLSPAFTNEEVKIMKKHNVPASVAYNRIHILKYERSIAITKLLGYGKGRRKENI